MGKKGVPVWLADGQSNRTGRAIPAPVLELQNALVPLEPRHRIGLSELLVLIAVDDQ
jgi:hypothetical protein